MKNHIREAVKEKQEFRDFGEVDFDDHEIELIEKQTEKDMDDLRY